MPPDPHAPTPCTENEPGIDYARLERIVLLALDAHGVVWVDAMHESGDLADEHGERFDPATLLALVLKARQRDAAEREIEACMNETRNFMRQCAYGVALDALRREP